MNCHTALIIVAAAGLIFTALGIVAVILQAAWMNRSLEQNKESEQ